MSILGGGVSLSQGSIIEKDALGTSINVGSGKINGVRTVTSSYPSAENPKAPDKCSTVEDPKLKDNLIAGSASVKTGYGVLTYNINNPLQAKAYKDVNIGNSSVLTLKGGTYTFNSLTMDYNSTLNLDLTGDDITIFVLGTVKIDNLAGIKVGTFDKDKKVIWKDMTQVDIANAAKVYLEAHSDINLAWGAEWFGTLFSSKQVSLNGNNTIIGAIAMLGQVNNLNWDNNIVYVPSNYAMSNW